MAWMEARGIEQTSGSPGRRRPGHSPGGRRKLEESAEDCRGQKTLPGTSRKGELATGWVLVVPGAQEGKKPDR